MATIGQFYYRVIVASDDKYYLTSDECTPKSFGDDGQILDGIYSNIVPLGTSWKKIGIQAPPGTQVVFGEGETAKTILIGRTGLYELDEDGITVSAITFIQPVNYVLDGSATAEALINGLEKIAEQSQIIQDLSDSLEKASTEESKKIIIDNLAIASTKLEEAIALYQSGLRGIYKKEGYDDLENVIVDYVTAD